MGHGPRPFITANHAKTMLAKMGLKNSEGAFLFSSFKHWKRMHVRIKGIHRLNAIAWQNKRMLLQKESEPIDLPFKTLILFIRLLWASERFQKCLLHTEVIFSMQKSFFWYRTERLLKCLLHTEIIKIEVLQPNTDSILHKTRL